MAKARPCTLPNFCWDPSKGQWNISTIFLRIPTPAGQLSQIELLPANKEHDPNQQNLRVIKMAALLVLWSPVNCWSIASIAFIQSTVAGLTYRSYHIISNPFHMPGTSASSMDTWAVRRIRNHQKKLTRILRESRTTANNWVPNSLIVSQQMHLNPSWRNLLRLYPSCMCRLLLICSG